MHKTAIITGASRGIGAATALRLAQDGYDVIVNYHSDHKSAQKVVEQVQSLGRKCWAIQADISQETQVVSLFKQADELSPNIDILINNAGILMNQQPLSEITQQRLDRIFSTNVFGCFICCREAIKRMSIHHGGNGGVIVNVSSAAARLGAANEYVDYAASKGAIDTLTIGLSQEVADQGIRVNAVRPAFIYTDMHADGGEANRVDRLKKNIPLNRGGEAQEVAAAIAWLCSDQSSYTTGAFIEVSGGK